VLKLGGGGGGENDSESFSNCNGKREGGEGWPVTPRRGEREEGSGARSILTIFGRGVMRPFSLPVQGGEKKRAAAASRLLQGGQRRWRSTILATKGKTSAG